ncbi:MAG TPA: FAD-linked oxidase C-terminal domain-containing protein, partial [Polyangiaceae bacterium]|nr:FAD-linked oxidase C-terminal domain-containing protein [Polyangiaceae bacterium]
MDPSRVEKALRLLHRSLGPSKIITSKDGCEPFARDESEAVGRTPDAVVLASTPKDVVLTLDCARRAGVPVTPRCAGTGRTGGAVPLRGGIVLSTLGMGDIKEINHHDRVAVVQPGVILEQFHDAVEREGLFYPPDPNSRASCGLGGNIAENAGGPRAVKYGVTRDYVLGVEMAAMTGPLIRMGRRTVKGVVGYDMTGLFVGSEGTLGVVTEATLALLHKPDMVLTLLAIFPTPHEAGRAVAAIFRSRICPRCVELMDAGALQAVRAQGVGIDPLAGALLLIEVDGHPAVVAEEAEGVRKILAEAPADEVHEAKNAQEAAGLAAARRTALSAVARVSPTTILEDTTVPRSHLAETFAEIERLKAKYQVRVATFGHAGDGNLHPTAVTDERNRKEIENVHAFFAELYEKVLAIGGTVSG